MNNPGVIMHDGNFGADWVNITRGPQLIAKVPYMPDGSQRDIARRIVWAWNNIDNRKHAAKYLAEQLRDVRDRIKPGMTPEAVVQLQSDIQITLALNHPL